MSILFEINPTTACLICDLELLQPDQHSPDFLLSAGTQVVWLDTRQKKNAWLDGTRYLSAGIPSSSPRLLLLAYWENEILGVNAAADELSSEAAACSSKRWSSWPRHASVNGGGSHRFWTPSIGWSPTDRVVFHTADRVLNLPADEMVDFPTSYPSILSLSTSSCRNYKSVQIYPNSSIYPCKKLYKLAT